MMCVLLKQSFLLQQNYILNLFNSSPNFKFKNQNFKFLNVKQQVVKESKVIKQKKPSDPRPMLITNKAVTPQESIQGCCHFLILNHEVVDHSVYVNQSFSLPQQVFV